MLHEISHTQKDKHCKWNLRKLNSENERGEPWLPGAEGRGSGGTGRCWLTGPKFQLQK